MGGGNEVDSIGASSHSKTCREAPVVQWLSRAPDLTRNRLGRALRRSVPLFRSLLLNAAFVFVFYYYVLGYARPRDCTAFLHVGNSAIPEVEVAFRSEKEMEVNRVRHLQARTFSGIRFDPMDLLICALGQGRS